MGEVVNLRAARKQRARMTAEVRADENRRLFGRTPAEKAAESAAKRRVENILDGARRDEDRPDETAE